MAVLNSFLRPLLGTRICSGSVRGPFGVRARSVRGPREVRSESVRVPSDKKVKSIFGETIKNCSYLQERRLGGLPPKNPSLAQTRKDLMPAQC